MFRYEYETVTYKQDDTTPHRLGRPRRGRELPGGQVCPKHVYLSKILYTAASTVSGEPEDPAYEVRFIRTPGRDAPTPSSTAAAACSTSTRTSWTTSTSSTARPASSSPVTTSATTPTRTSARPACGPSPRSAATACPPVPTTGLKHTFAYFDDVATAGSGFDTAAKWDTGANPSSGGTAAYINQKLSGLGSSMTDAGDGKIYVGFNLADPEKTGSVGGSFAMNGTTNRSVIEFIDLNGDALPDKVYREVISGTGPSGEIRYQLNTSRPTTSRTADLTFGPMHTLAGFSDLPVQRTIGIQGGIEAYFGVYGVFNVGGQWSWVDSYFTDANGDGLVDLVSGTQVLFNHLVCAAGPRQASSRASPPSAPPTPRPASR